MVLLLEAKANKIKMCFLCDCSTFARISLTSFNQTIVNQQPQKRNIDLLMKLKHSNPI